MMDLLIPISDMDVGDFFYTDGQSYILLRPRLYWYQTEIDWNTSIIVSAAGSSNIDIIC
jgi:hypothetical protein